MSSQKSKIEKFQSAVLDEKTDWAGTYVGCALAVFRVGASGTAEVKKEAALITIAKVASGAYSLTIGSGTGVALAFVLPNGDKVLEVSLTGRVSEEGTISSLVATLIKNGKVRTLTFLDVATGSDEAVIFATFERSKICADEVLAKAT